MSEHETVQADHRKGAAGKGRRAGLLRFFPPGEPPEMSFVALRPQMTMIGRSDDCAVQIEDDEVSRKHALIDGSEGEWQIGDCESANGVSVNGRKIDTCQLAGGEVIRIGSALFRFLRSGYASASCGHPIRTDGMIGGPALEAVLELLDRAAGSDLSVLITGETGTGKELAARRLHERGGRSEGPFIPVNCAAIPTEIFESELFGHVAGAFTGATADKPGLVRQASGGTLFLDEIGELPLGCQAKLLRVLQDHVVHPVGSASAVPTDIRVVCATNRDLRHDAAEGKFRVDLYPRVAELTVRLPPLRERLEDIPALAAHFIDKHGERRCAASVGALEALCCRRWPFNVRELESAVRRAILLAGGGRSLEPEHFAEEGSGELGEPAIPVTPAESPTASEDPEATHLREVLRRHGGDVKRAAHELGISESQLYRRAKKLKIRPAHFRC